MIFMNGNLEFCLKYINDTTVYHEYKYAKFQAVITKHISKMWGFEVE